MTTLVPGASAPTIFNFRSTEVRTLVLDGEAWFVASDVARALGYPEAKDMTRILDADESGRHNVPVRSENGVEQNREVTIINESGLYHAVLKSRKPEAKPFRKWVTSEVLPAIRKTGQYAATSCAASPLDYQRILLMIEHGQISSATPVKPGACIIDPASGPDLVSLIGEYVPFDRLQEVIGTAHRRMMNRFDALQRTA